MVLGRVLVDVLLAVKLGIFSRVLVGQRHGGVFGRGDAVVRVAEGCAICCGGYPGDSAVLHCLLFSGLLACLWSGLFAVANWFLLLFWPWC